MPRTNQQIGQLAFALYDALSKVDLSHDELKSLGECLYARAKIDRVSVAAKKKLFLAARELDSLFPLPEPVAAAPAPSAISQQPPATPPAPASFETAAPTAPAPAATPEAPPPAISSNGVSIEEGPRG